MLGVGIGAAVSRNLIGWSDPNTSAPFHTTAYLNNSSLRSEQVELTPNESLVRANDKYYRYIGTGEVTGQLSDQDYTDTSQWQRLERSPSDPDTNWTETDLSLNRYLDTYKFYDTTKLILKAETDQVITAGVGAGGAAIAGSKSGLGLAGAGSGVSAINMVAVHPKAYILSLIHI